MYRQVIQILTFMIIVSGCSTRTQYKPLQQNTKKHYAKKLPNHTQRTLPYQLQNETPYTLALYKEYARWYATPYKYGGTTNKGVDCSALVQQIYKAAFGIQLPRTTKEQMKQGRFAKRSMLRTGDILFFKTNYKNWHSGIYLENGYFIHASTKHGVTISSIHNPYWKSKYYQARRILSKSGEK